MSVAMNDDQLFVSARHEALAYERFTCCMSCLGVSRRGCGDGAGAGDASAAPPSVALAATSEPGAVALELLGECC